MGKITFLDNVIELTFYLNQKLLVIWVHGYFIIAVRQG